MSALIWKKLALSRRLKNIGMASEKLYRNTLRHAGAFQMSTMVNFGIELTRR